MTEPRWTYVTPADSPNRVLHLPGCRMMTETEKLGRVRTVEHYDDRDPLTLGDLLCKHCQKRVRDEIKGRLEALKARVKVAETEPDYDHEIQGWYAEDVPWLIKLVERLHEVPLL